jgi:quercetin dioxygenase-like cupin family protein
MMTGFHELATLPLEKVTEHYSRRVLVGAKEMIVWATLRAGAHAAAHRHPQEQMFWILTGRADFRLGDERRSCGPGTVIVVPGDVEHEMWCPVDTDFVAVLSPLREDLLPGAPPPAHLLAGRA